MINRVPDVEQRKGESPLGRTIKVCSENRKDTRGTRGWGKGEFGGWSRYIYQAVFEGDGCCLPCIGRHKGADSRLRLPFQPANVKSATHFEISDIAQVGVHGRC